MSNFKMTDEQYNRLVAQNFGVPPVWAKGCVATNAGWMNPRTKEVVFASGGLARRIQEFMEEKARREAAKQEVVDETPKVVVKLEAPISKVEVEVKVEKKEEPKVEVKTEAPAADEPVRWKESEVTFVDEVSEEKVVIETKPKSRSKKKGKE